MIRPYLLHNGQILSSADHFLAAGQVGLLSGWGVFSTVRVVDGVLFCFDRHWARMKKDAELLRVPFPWTAAELERELLALVEANADAHATLRVCVFRNRGTIFEGPGLSGDHELVAFTAPGKDWGAGARLCVVPEARHAACRFASAKTLSWAMNLVLHEEAHLAGYDEAVLLNERGEVSECTSANLFAVFGDTALTPPLDSGCLPGVTRSLLLEEVRAGGIAVREQTLHVDDFARADEVFMTSTTRNLLPVLAIEGIAVNRRGDARARLSQAFDQYTARYVAAHRR